LTAQQKKIYIGCMCEHLKLNYSNLSELDLAKFKAIQEVKSKYPDAIPMRARDKWEDCIIYYDFIDKIGVYYDLPDSLSSKTDLFHFKNIKGEEK